MSSYRHPGVYTLRGKRKKKHTSSTLKQGFSSNQIISALSITLLLLKLYWNVYDNIWPIYCIHAAFYLPTGRIWSDFRLVTQIYRRLIITMGCGFQNCNEGPLDNASETPECLWNIPWEPYFKGSSEGTLKCSMTNPRTQGFSLYKASKSSK